ncbi:MAG TPA: O-antigen ligase family protein [Acidimicrobiales bacterium]|nr:O-antigen ligase family protein [Acidimicrobiales bacterium]
MGLLCGALLIPGARYRAMWLPLALGLVAGAVAVGTSLSVTPTPWLAVAVVGCALAAALITPPPLPRPSRRTLTLAAVAIGLAALGTVAFLHSEISLRFLSGAALFDRNPEWAAAVHQFNLAPWSGVGSDRILPFIGTTGVYAHFAHNEYLQVAADAGIIGLGLLGLSACSVAWGVRRVNVATSCAAAALVAFAVTGAFDYDWHVPALALIGGWVAGLAGPPGLRRSRRAGQKVQRAERAAQASSVPNP